MPRFELGEALLAARRVAEARAASRLADKPLAAALAKSDAVTAWRNYADEAELLEAALALAGGQPAAALRLDQLTMSRLGATDRPLQNAYVHWLLAQTHMQTGDALSALGRPAAARAQWTWVLQNLSEPREPKEPKLLVILANVDVRTGARTEPERSGGASRLPVARRLHFSAMRLQPGEAPSRASPGLRQGGRQSD